METCEDGDPDPLVPPQLLHPGSELLPHGLSQGVQLLGGVQGDEGDLALALQGGGDQPGAVPDPGPLPTCHPARQSHNWAYHHRSEIRGTTGYFPVPSCQLIQAIGLILTITDRA